MSVTIQLEHPEVDIPQGAVIIPQVPGNRRFNAWARRVALKGWEKEQAVVYFYVDEMVPPVLGLRRRMSKWLDAGGFLHHMRRVSLVFARQAPDIRVYYTPVEDSRFYSHGRGASLTQIQAILHEYAAIVVYWWREWI